MYQVYFDTVKADVSAAKFVSVQADETTDVFCRSQFAVTVRFVRRGLPVERLLSFYEAKYRTASGLTCLLKKALEPFSLHNKMIAQAYDGAAVMSGRNNGVQSKMRECFPYAYFVHCYALQLNLVMKRVCSSIKDVRVFFANVSGFSTFFSVSPNDRTCCVLRVTGLPRPYQTRWNFQSQSGAKRLEQQRRSHIAVR